jgi:Mg2+/Co2+ transporter CorB
VDDLPLSALALALLVLLTLSAFFSMSETVMMAANRHRLRHLAQRGDRGAQLAEALLARTSRLLGVIVLASTFVNTTAATLVCLITIGHFGERQWQLGLAALVTTLGLLIFAEITPKVVGAAYADRLIGLFGYLWTPLIKLLSPAVWFVDGAATLLQRTFGIRRPVSDVAPPLTQEELRSLVMESRELIPGKAGSVLHNLFELGEVKVEDIMTPRGQVEVLDIDAPWDEVQSHLANCQHGRLPVCSESLDRLIGVLHVRRLVGQLQREEFDVAALIELAQAPYYVPAGTAAFSQLTFFQENRQRVGFVVDEYGEILGILTLEDIVEEIVGEFTTSLPGAGHVLTWAEDGTVLVDGSRSLRDLKRQLGLNFPLAGPKTLNGLILEYFRDIPEAGVGLKIAGIAIEIIQTQDRSVRTARLFRPAALR